MVLCACVRAWCRGTGDVVSVLCCVLKGASGGLRGISLLEFTLSKDALSTLSGPDMNTPEPPPPPITTVSEEPRVVKDPLLLPGCLTADRAGSEREVSRTITPAYGRGLCGGEPADPIVVATAATPAAGWSSEEVGVEGCALSNTRLNSSESSMVVRRGLKSIRNWYLPSLRLRVTINASSNKKRC